MHQKDHWKSRVPCLHFLAFSRLVRLEWRQTLTAFHQSSWPLALTLKGQLCMNVYRNSPRLIFFSLENYSELNGKSSLTRVVTTAWLVSSSHRRRRSTSDCTTWSEAVSTVFIMVTPMTASGSSRMRCTASWGRRRCGREATWRRPWRSCFAEQEWERHLTTPTFEELRYFF